MKRQMIRLLFAALIVAFTVIAARIWTVDYEKNADPKARFTIAGAMVRSDHSYRWVELHLRKNGEDIEHDLRIPVRLVTADGTEHEPADTIFAGSPEEGFTDIWFKFYLEESELKGQLKLRLNGGSLHVKTNDGLPSLGGDGKAVFKYADWGKSWLGF